MRSLCLAPSLVLQAALLLAASAPALLLAALAPAASAPADSAPAASALAALVLWLPPSRVAPRTSPSLPRPPWSGLVPFIPLWKHPLQSAMKSS